MRRIPTIIGGLFVAMLIAGFVLAVGVVVPDLSNAESDSIDRLRFLAGEFFAASYGPVIALGLACVAIAVAEARRIRSVYYYMIAGGVIGLLASYGVDMSAAIENTTDIAPMSFARTVSALAGAISGVVYWAIAARRAWAISIPVD